MKKVVLQRNGELVAKKEEGFPVALGKIKIAFMLGITPTVTRVFFAMDLIGKDHMQKLCKGKLKVMVADDVMILRLVFCSE